MTDKYGFELKIMEIWLYQKSDTFVPQRLKRTALEIGNEYFILRSLGYKAQNTCLPIFWYALFSHLIFLSWQNGNMCSSRWASSLFPCADPEYSVRMGSWHVIFIPSVINIFHRGPYRPPSTSNLTQGGPIASRWGPVPLYQIFYSCDFRRGVGGSRPPCPPPPSASAHHFPFNCILQTL